MLCTDFFTATGAFFTMMFSGCFSSLHDAANSIISGRAITIYFRFIISRVFTFSLFLRLYKYKGIKKYIKTIE